MTDERRRLLEQLDALIALRKQKSPDAIAFYVNADLMLALRALLSVEGQPQDDPRAEYQDAVIRGLLGALRGIVNIEGVRETVACSAFGSLLAVSDAALKWGGPIRSATWDEAMKTFGEGQPHEAPRDGHAQDCPRTGDPCQCQMRNAWRPADAHLTPQEPPQTCAVHLIECAVPYGPCSCGADERTGLSTPWFRPVGQEQDGK